MSQQEKGFPNQYQYNFSDLYNVIVCKTEERKYMFHFYYQCESMENLCKLHFCFS